MIYSFLLSGCKSKEIVLEEKFPKIRNVMAQRKVKAKEQANTSLGMGCCGECGSASGFDVLAGGLEEHRGPASLYLQCEQASYCLIH